MAGAGKDLTPEIRFAKSSELTSEKITSYYLYGTETPSVGLQGLDERLRPIVENSDKNTYIDGNQKIKHEEIKLVFDQNEYFSSGPGRFIKASEIKIIDLFFTQQTFHDKNGIPITGERSAQYLRDNWADYSYYTFNLVPGKSTPIFSRAFNHTAIGINSTDYGERIYIWLSDRISLNASENNADGIKFDFGATGALSERKITNLKLEPDNQDFNFKGGSDLGGIYGDLFVEPKIDPYGIGRTVALTFDRSGSGRTYTKSDFDADRTFAQNNTHFLGPEGGPLSYASGRSALDGVVERIVSSPEFLSEIADFKIIYGTGGDDTSLSLLQLNLPGLGDVLKFEKSILVGGPGSDRFVTSIGIDEIFLGGDYSDAGIYSDPAYDKHRNDADSVDYRVKVGSSLTNVEANDSPVTILLGEGPQSEDGVITVGDDQGGIDILLSIEKIFGSFQDDTVILTEVIDAQIEDLKFIDFVGGSNNTIALLTPDTGWEVDLTDPTHQVARALPSDGAAGEELPFYFRNANTVQGGEKKEFVFGTNFKNPASGADPLVLDLDGDGLALSSLSLTSPRFDIDGDGFAERTGWIGGRGRIARP